MEEVTNWLQARLFIIGILYVLSELTLLSKSTDKGKGGK